MTTERKAAVAGMFYPGEAHGLTQWIERELRPVEGEKRRVKGIILPHAGYIYSGPCALRALERVVIPPRVVVVGLNHRYHHERLVLDGSESWETPLGSVSLDLPGIKRLLTDEAVFVRDSRLGAQEHSLEVMLPLLQYFRKDFILLPVLVGCSDPSLLLAAAARLADLIREGPDTLLLASTDMSHYLSAEAAEAADRPAIERVLALDPAGLIETVARQNISMCGVFSTALVMETVRLLGGSRGEQVCYTNSGVVTGDSSSVVAYLSAILD